MRMVEQLGCNLISDSIQREKICEAIINLFRSSSDLIDQSGNNLAALLSVVTVLSSWREGYGKGARRIVAEIVSCAQKMLDNEVVGEGNISKSGKEEKSSESEAESVRSPSYHFSRQQKELREQKFLDYSLKIRSLLSLAILTVSDRHFPNGVTNLIAHFLASSENKFGAITVTEKSIEAVREKVSISDLRRRTSDLELQLGELKNREEEFGDRILAFLKPWVVAGSLVVWFSVILIVVFLGWSIYESMNSYILNRDFSENIGVFLAALPLGSGYIWFLVSHNFLSLNPRKLSVEKARNQMSSRCAD